jgi:hypothetical protein
MSKKLRLLLLVLEAMLLALRILPTAGDHDDDHHYVPGWHTASERWDVSVSDEKLTTALLDRLTHYAHILTTRGDSYRASKRKTSTDNRSPPSNQKE